MKDFLRLVVIPLGIALLFLIAVFVATKPEPPREFGPDTKPPVDAPTLDYESMVGLDPQTQTTNQQRERLHQLEGRVEALETLSEALRSELQTMQQSRAVRLGDFPPPVEEPEE